MNVNPAGLAALKSDEFSFTQEFWVQNLSAEHISYGHPFGDLTLALGGDYLNFGSVDQYSLNGSGLPVSNGAYSPTGLDFKAGLGVKLGAFFEAGLSAKALYQGLSASDQAWAGVINLGLIHGHLDKGFRFGLAFQNLGTTLDGASLPALFDFSLAYVANLAPGHLLTLTADGGVNLSQSDHSAAGVGLEYVYQDILALRLGYRGDEYGNLTGLSGFSSGIGIHVAPLELGFALTTLGDLGTTQEISLKNYF